MRSDLIGACAFIASFGISHAQSSCAAQDSTGTSICTVDTKTHPLALCNDGTQAKFAFRAGQGGDRKTWLIWLEGGGQCTDIVSCKKRGQTATGLLTSNGFSGAPNSGILSSDSHVNPRLHNANVVVVHYCSSDDWAGGHQSAAMFDAADPATWNFQGRRIALAAVASIHEVAPGFRFARQILLGGSSAGGLGITVTANDILPRLPPAPDIRVINDAGFALDVGQYDSSIGSPYMFAGSHNAFNALFKSGMALWQGRGDAVCDAAAGSVEDRVNCFSAKVFQDGYIALPSFVAESQLDTAQLSDEICPADYGQCQISHNVTSNEGVYATAFALDMAHALQGNGTPASYAVFSPDSYMHTILTNAGQFGQRYAFPGAMLSAQRVFGRWLDSPNGARIVEIGNGPGVTAVPSP